jgi:hypothetical protein
VEFFNQAEDVFEVQRGLNNCFAHDLVPAPSGARAVESLNEPRRLTHCFSH